MAVRIARSLLVHSCRLEFLSPHPSSSALAGFAARPLRPLVTQGAGYACGMQSLSTSRTPNPTSRPFRPRHDAGMAVQKTDCPQQLAPGSR